MNDQGPVLTPLSAEWSEYDDTYQYGVWPEIMQAREAVEAAIRAPLEAERDWLIKQRSAMLARGFIQPCFLDTAAEIPDKCAGATYQCFYCKKWWCETHAGGHFETEPAAALAGVPKEAASPEVDYRAMWMAAEARIAYLSGEDSQLVARILFLEGENETWKGLVSLREARIYELERLLDAGVVAAPVEDAK